MRGGIPARILILQVAVTAAAFAVFAWRFDLAAVPGLLSDVSLPPLVLGLVAFTASKVVHAYRWHLLLGSRPELSTRRLLPVFLIGNMVNALVPFRAGDVVRVELPSRRFHLGRGALAGSVFVVETVTDLVAFALLLGAAGLVLEFPSRLRPLVLAMSLLAVVAFAIALGVARRGPREVERTGWFSVLPARWRVGARRGTLAFLEGLSSLRDNRQATAALAVACLAWAAELPVWWLIARAFGHEASLGDALVLMTAANVVVSLPLTPWDLGTYELLVSEAYVTAGAGRGEAAAFAIGSHLVLHAWIAVTGIVAMWWLGVAPRDLARRPRSEEPVP